jgi:hypothetical protein
VNSGYTRRRNRAINELAQVLPIQAQPETTITVAVQESRVFMKPEQAKNANAACPKCGKTGRGLTIHMKHCKYGNAG